MYLHRSLLGEFSVIVEIECMGTVTNDEFTSSREVTNAPPLCLQVVLSHSLKRMLIVNQDDMFPPRQLVHCIIDNGKALAKQLRVQRPARIPYCKSSNSAEFKRSYRSRIIRPDVIFHSRTNDFPYSPPLSHSNSACSSSGSNSIPCRKALTNVLYWDPDASRQYATYS